MNKKAQGISVNVIIIAAIALIVLVVLVAIFTGRLGSFSTDLNKAGANCAQACQAIGKTGSGTGTDTPQGDDYTTIIVEGETKYCTCT